MDDDSALLRGPAPVSYTHLIIAIIVTAVLLRANVVLVLLPDGGTEVAVAGSMVLVAVAFHRTHPEVTDAGHFFWQEQAQAEARQFGKYRVALSVQCQRYCTACLLYTSCMREAKIVLLVRDKKFHILECDAFRTLKAIITVIPVSYTHLVILWSTITALPAAYGLPPSSCQPAN